MPDTMEPEIRKYQGGAVIFIRGDAGDCAYRVVTGSVQIREAGRALETIMPGGLFGEMALIDGGARSASAVAVGETTVEIIDRPMFDQLIRQQPDFAVNVMRDMARRLRVMNEKQRPAETLPLPRKPMRSA